MSAVEVIAKQGRAVQVSLGSVLLLLVGTGALFASSSLLEFSVFFIIPVTYFSWFIHRKAGTIASAVSAALTLCANIASPVHIAHPRCRVLECADLVRLFYRRHIHCCSLEIIA